MARRVVIDVEARFVDNVTDEAKAAAKSFEGVEKAAEEATKDVDKLGKTNAKPKVTMDADRAAKKLDDLDKKLNKIGKSKTEAKLSVMDKASALIDKVMSKAKSFANRTYSGLVKLRDSNALSTLNKMSNGLKGLTQKAWSVAVKIKDTFTAPLTKLKNMLFSVKSLVTGIATALAVKWTWNNLIKSPIDVADAYSSAKISFSTLLGESQGQQMMDNLDEFARATPFNTTNVISNAQKMLAMGWDAENIIEDMETIGNAAAATGKMDQGLESIVRALSQIKTKGKLSTEELNQLAEAGIAAKAMLAENLGYGTGDEGIAKMTKDLEDGAIASGVAIEALMAGMQKYDGMMDSMANETVDGLWSQIKDTFNINVVRKWGQGLQDGAKKGFGTLVTLLDKAEGALENLGDMLYELGKTASNWAAEKLQGVVDKILTITDTFEFKNASLKEKFSMLWNGVIADPLKEWWENGGEQKTAETAGKIGSWMGKMLTKGLLAIFGATDVLNDGIGTEAGSNIAGSFLDGFLDNFDGQAITDAFVNAIKNVWGALPWWAKTLIGGYGIGKVAGGVSNVAGGVANFIGGAKNVIGSATSMTGLLGLGSNAAIALGAGNLAGGASLGAGALSALGLGATAGGLVGGVTLIKGFSDLHKSVKNADNLTENHAYLASGGSAVGGVAAGAGIGAAIGSVVPVLGTAVGALIGAGLGGVAGWIGGEKWAANIRAAQFSSEEMQEAVKDTKMSSEELAAIWEKAVWKRSRDIFGDIELSTAEISAMSRKIVLGDKVAAMDEFASAASQAEASLQSLQNSVSVLDRWNWKAGLGLSLTDDEQESYVGAIDSFINNAKSYLESQQYEFTAAVRLLMDTGEGSAGAGIISSNDAFYAGLQEQVAGYSSQLQELLSTALENGNLGDKIDITIDGRNFTVDEQSAIEMLQQKIADITNSVNAAKEKAQLDMIEIKFKNSSISYESYEELQAGIDEYMETALGNLDEAQLAVLTNLNLQLDKAGTEEEKAKIQEQINQTLESYGVSVDEVHANVNDFILDLAVEKFSADDLLGPDALSQIEDVLSRAVIEGIQPGELTGDDITRMLGLENFDQEAAQVLANILNNLDFNVDEQTGGKVAESVASKIDEITPDVMNEEVTVYLSAVENIINSIDLVAEEFGIHPAYAEHILWELSGEKSIENRIDILCNEFGIEKTQAEEILWKLTGRKQITPISFTAGDFGIRNSYSYSPTVNVTPRLGALGKITMQGGGSGYRGGIFGGDSAMDAFARGGLTDNSGIVGGSTRFIRVNEESPEMIIPLSDQRRGRALKLWAQAGNIMGVPGFARGGIIGGNNTDEGFRFRTFGSSDSAGGRTVHIDMGGVRFEINVNGSDREGIVEAIKAQAGELADYVVGLIADALETEFENTPVRGGA